MKQNKQYRSGICGFRYTMLLHEENKRKCRKTGWRVTLTTFKVFTLIFVVIFVILPLIYRFSYKLQSSIVFLNFAREPFNADYNNPAKYGLDGARNFYLTTGDNIKLGVWQILPENLTYTTNETDIRYFENILGNGQNVVIYHHGNAGNRLSGHRVELYKVLRKYFHVIAFDYRSYGDSSNVQPSEDAVVSDSMFIYHWVSNRTTGNIFVWGHSLGTSIAIHSLSLLQKQGLQPAGVVLEAPFNNMREEITEFPFSRIFKCLPWFAFTVIDPMQANGFKFQTDRYICKVDAPILILHAKDDHVVPYKLGKKLYDTALKCRTDIQGKIMFHGFDGKHHYGHKFIYRAPELHEIIRNFISTAIQECEEKHLRISNT